MLNEFKDRKLIEFQNKIRSYKYADIDTDTFYDLKQFISDLIDEMVGAIPPEVLMNDDRKEELGNDVYRFWDGHNRFRETLINNLNNK